MRSLNDLTGFGRSKSKKGLSNILNDEGKLLDGADAANYMNNFYTTAGPKLATKFKNDWSEDQSKIKTDSAFSFEVISEDTVRRLCKDIKLSKSSAMGLLSTRILKDCFEVCTLELTHVFNTCLDSGIFPFSWGTGQITPIPKISVSNKKPENWRPITQIKLPGKILERCIHSQIFNYVDINEILSPQQHEFVPKKSTATAVFDILKNVYQNWNDKCYTLCKFVDFSHAFDTIDHQILLRKLKQYGFDCMSLKFISSYLGSRRQFTVVNGYTSECQKVTYGIAQGSIVGPLIYLLYANDIFSKITDPNAILMYADDTLLLSKGKSVSECEEHCQDMLNKFMVRFE